MKKSIPFFTPAFRKSLILRAFRAAGISGCEPEDRLPTLLWVLKGNPDPTGMWRRKAVSEENREEAGKSSGNGILTQGPKVGKGKAKTAVCGAQCM